MRPDQLLTAYLEHVDQVDPADHLDEIALVARPEPSLSSRLEARRGRAQERFDRDGLPRVTVIVGVA